MSAGAACPPGPHSSPARPAGRPGTTTRKIHQLSVAPLIGEAIRRIHHGESVGALFTSDAALVEEMVLWTDGGTDPVLDPVRAAR